MSLASTHHSHAPQRRRGHQKDQAPRPLTPQRASSRTTFCPVLSIEGFSPSGVRAQRERMG